VAAGLTLTYLKYTCAGGVLVIRLVARNAMVIMVQGRENRDLEAALSGFGRVVYQHERGSGG